MLANWDGSHCGPSFLHCFSNKNIAFVNMVCFLLGNTVKFIEMFLKIIYNIHTQKFDYIYMLFKGKGC